MTKRWMTLATASLTALLALFAPAPFARADIFQWEYINPANPSQGKQQSTTLSPGGAGANAVPGTNLSSHNLTKAYLIGANLSQKFIYFRDGSLSQRVFANFTSANLSQADLTNAIVGGAMLINANLSQANLTNAIFGGHQNAFGYYYSPTGADLTGANLTGAEVRGANFYRDSYYGGTGITAAQLSSTASYLAHDLTGIGLAGNNLAGANLAGQILINASFTGATLTGANLSEAEVRGTDFSRYWDPYSSADITGGITLAQLYSTASYQAHDLGAIGLGSNELAGANLASQNLVGASFRGISFADEGGGYTFARANLTGADLSGADARGADFYATRLSGANLSQANLQNASFAGDQFYDANTNLANANLSGADARGANFALATLSGANFTNAEVQGADFAESSITTAQIYSTASYQNHDLSGIRLWGIDLTGANFAGQNLTNAVFIYGRLAGANLSQANLTNANFSTINDVIPDLTGANLSGVDSRGANLQYAILAGSNTSNLIQSDGHIAGLDLTAGESLVVRDYDGNPGYLWYPYTPTGPLPIVVDEHFAMGTGGRLRTVFEADAWDSTISFAAGIPVALGGTLELTFSPDVNLTSQIGRTFDLFDWTGVSPTGAFAIGGPYVWDLSNLYTSGEIIFLAASGLAGDFNGDGRVDAADYTAWRDHLGSSYTQAAYPVWKIHFGASFGAGSGAALPSVAPLSPAVPEPATAGLLIVGMLAIVSLRRASVS